MSKNKLFLIRHGIRGFHEPIPALGQELQLLAASENITLEGHLLCYKLGQYIVSNYGKPNIIIAEQSVRTIDSAISIARACELNEISIEDRVLNAPLRINDEDIDLQAKLLRENKEQINSLKQASEKILNNTLASESTIDPVNGNVYGLIQQLNVLGSIMLFDEAAKMSHPLLEIREKMMQIHPIIWSIRMSSVKQFEWTVNELFSSIVHFLSTSQISVIVGHEHNMIQIARFLDIVYRVPEFAEFWVPANSGFLFSLSRGQLKLKLFYLSRNREFKTHKYALLSLPSRSNYFHLTPRIINYQSHF